MHAQLSLADSPAYLQTSPTYLPYILTLTTKLNFIAQFLQHITTKPTATSTSHFNAKSVTKTNMPTKLSAYVIYPKYLMCIHGECMCKYVPHMKHVH